LDFLSWLIPFVISCIRNEALRIAYIDVVEHM